jgi:ATP-dependent Lon protease
MVKEHERMLTGGFYAEVTLGYDAAIAQEKGGRPFGVDVAAGHPALEARRARRAGQGRRAASPPPSGSDLLLRSVGLEPTDLTERAKDALLLRMVPFVERNYNLVELGPRGTGKSHLFQQVSPYAHLISGGKATVARMFVNNANGQRGLVCQYDVVCFDEVSGVSFDQKDGVNIMKGYMESGEFSRGKESIRADGSIVLVGNFDVDVEHQQRVGHLFSARCRPRCATTPRSWTASTASCRAGTCPSSAPAVHRPLRPGERLPVRVLHPAAQPEPGRPCNAGSVLGRCAVGPRHQRRQQDRERPAEAAVPRPRDPVSDEDLEWAVRLAWSAPAREGAAEAHRRGRVPQHALQLHLGAEGVEKFVSHARAAKPERHRR